VREREEGRNMQEDGPCGGGEDGESGAGCKSSRAAGWLQENNNNSERTEA
jgi:hypothetical protein